LAGNIPDEKKAGGDFFCEAFLPNIFQNSCDHIVTITEPKWDKFG